MIKKIEDYQLKELKDETLYINIYDLELEYSYELAKYWKEFFFDILQSLGENDYTFNLDYLEKNSLFSYMMDNYKEIINRYNLNIDIRDYIEINDYVTLKEWETNPDNGIGYFIDGVYLIQK